MTSRFFWAVCGAIAVTAGCSSGFTTGTGGGGTTTSTGATSGETGGNKTTSSTSSTTSATTTVTGSTSSVTMPTCPPLGGTYSMIATGLGCDGVADTAGECIKMGNAPCEFSIDTNGAGVAGSIDVDSTGGFTNATLKLNGTTRTGCMGSVTQGAAMKTIVVDCGGTGTSQSCHIVLTRTADGCTF